MLCLSGGDDKEVKLGEKRLMKVSDASGKITLTEVGSPAHPST